MIMQDNFFKFLACNHGDVRLRNGATTFEGRVEICFNGVWGTVTHDWWNWQDAKVVCKQLGIMNSYNDSKKKEQDYIR